MIVSSVRARIVRDTPAALLWAQEIADWVKGKTGSEVEVMVRIGATQDVVWSQRFADLAAYGENLDAIQADPEYHAKVHAAQDAGLFAAGSVEGGIWRVL